MSLVKNDYVYVSPLKKYGRIVGILSVSMFKEEETFYTVTFEDSFSKDSVFKESNLVKLEPKSFPIGSRVTGLKRAERYRHTTDKATMEVIDKCNNGKILVKILQHENNPHTVGREFWVDSIWFRYIKPPSNFIR